MTSEEIAQSVIATVEAVAQELKRLEYPGDTNHPYQIELVTGESVHLLNAFVQSQPHARRYGWDWGTLYRTHVRNSSSGWMYALVKVGEVGSMCCGQIELDLDEEIVTIECLERLPSATELRGLATLVADLFATTLAELIEAKAVWLINPDPALVDFYVGFGYTPHTDEESASDRVAYMRKEIAQ